MATSRSDSRRLSLRKDMSAGSDPMTVEPPPFRRVLVANRGEIAVRIIRACHEMGMEAVAVYSDADAAAAHVRLADAAVRLGPPPPSESYLRIDAVVEAATVHRRRGDPSRLRVPRRASGLRARRRGGRARLRGSGLGCDRGARRQAAMRAGLPPASACRPCRERWSPHRSTAPTRWPRSSPPRGTSASRCWSRRRRAAAAAGMRRVDPRGGSRRRRSWPGRARRRRRSATGRSTSSGRSCPRGTSRSSSSAMPTGTSSRWASGTARSSAATRSWSRRRRHPASPRQQRRHLHGLAVALGDGGRAAQCRDLRVPPRPGRQLLVPRGQHPAPGRARRDGAGGRRGHRPRAVPDRRRARR